MRLSFSPFQIFKPSAPPRSPRFWSATALVFALSSHHAAHATVVLSTDPTNYTGPTINLSTHANGGYNFTFGPVSLPGGITLTANPGGNGNSGQGSIVGQGSYNLGANGIFRGSATYIGVDSQTGFDTLSFAQPVSQFGAYWNYAPSTGMDPVLKVFNAANAQIGSFDLAQVAPIATPASINQFAFRAVVDSKADIASVQFGGAYLVLAGTPSGDVASAVNRPLALAVTSDTAPDSPLPLPPSLALLGTACAALGFLRWRRKPVF